MYADYVNMLQPIPFLLKWLEKHKTYWTVIVIMILFQIS